MCNASDYAHLGQPDPEPTDTTCPVCGQDNHPAFGGCSCYGTSEPELDDARARWLMTERSRLLSLSGLPLEADALLFAQSLRFVP